MFLKFYHSHTMRIVRKAIRSIVLKPVNVWNFFKLKSKIKNSTGALYIVIGSEKTRYNNWLSTNIEHLNLLKLDSFEALFGNKKVDRFLAEHVFEHLHYEDVLLALKHCYQYMNKGGVIRIAVPDGFHPNPDYINMVKPGGSGYGSDDHKLLYNYRLLSEALEATGFKPYVLEYYDEEGKFHFNEWKSEDGHVNRSMRYDKRFHEPIAYSSLIVDGIK